MPFLATHDKSSSDCYVLGHVHAYLVAHFKWAFDDQNWKVKRDKAAV